MKRLFVTADIHGSLNAWMTIKKLMKPDDSLVIAGDLFDTRYGSTSSDFQPEFIKEALNNLPGRFYYVYGNCDQASFFPGHGSTLEFSALGKKHFLHHGHGRIAIPNNSDIIISGHTHICLLEKKGNQIFMNPGTITNPRNQLYTYGIIDQFQARILDLKTGENLSTMELSP